jgi:3-dehydroquinate dehydratase
MAYANNDPGAAIKVLREMRLSMLEEEDSQLNLILSYLDDKRTIKFTVDPKDIGLKKYTEEETQKLYKKALDSIQDNIVDVPHQIVKDEEN